MTISPPASPYTPQPQPEPFVSPQLTVIITVILLIFFFLGFFTLYFCKCFIETLVQAWHLQNPSENIVRPPETNVNNGLDPQIIRSFPSFPYSSVKDLRSQKYGLECAICLTEFSDEHLLRLLTICCHIFHQECIDLWLESHRTCPVCRRNLEPSASSDLENDDIITIDVIQENDDGDNVVSDVRSGQSSDRSKKESRRPPEKFSRSHSTGHSIVRNKPEEEDRYTLRLPEHVKIKMARGHNQTESCITFGELTRNIGCRNRRFGEVSGQSQSEN